MASHRFSEELFLWIPLKEFGSAGKFGKWMSLIPTDLISCDWARDSNKVSSVIPAKDSGKDPYDKDYGYL